MELENISTGKGLDLVTAGSPIPKECFAELVEEVKKCYRSLGVNSQTMHLEYQRFANANSVLAIKLIEGSNFDKENYMFVGSSANKYSDKIHCDVFMHADAKCANRASKIASAISRKIVKFFEQTEEELEKNGMSDFEFSVSIPLSEDKSKTEKEQTKDNCIKTFIKKIIKNKKS